MNHSEWEAICRQCGGCCCEKTQYDDGTIVFGDPCEFRDPITMKCTVYADRFTRRPDCIQLTVEVVRTMPILPPGCAYLEWLEKGGPDEC